MPAVAVASPFTATRSNRAIAVWLLLCAALVFAMAVIGAVTRLTESGLSITRWDLVTGALPPASEAEWQHAFDLYRATPEYQLRNSGMALEAFKGIYWWEWIHRNWGRLIGAVFMAGFLWFWIRGQIPRPLFPKLLGLLALGALQGALGWFMVMSGLVDRPSVSHYRLAMHLGLAALIFAFLLAVALDLFEPAPRSGFDPDAPGVRTFAWGGLALVAITLVWGAFVAGLDAGLAYNTFPLMGEHWLPPEADTLNPWWLNLFENTAAVQFVHRWLGVGCGVVLLLFWMNVRASDLPASANRIADMIAMMVMVQVGLGIATLLSAVPVSLGAAHQAGALTLVGLLVWMLHETKTPRLVQE